MQDLTRDIVRTPVLVDAGAIQVYGELTLPSSARGIVVLVHGLGSRWNDPRNRSLAGSLARQGLGSLACELFTDDEEALDRITRHLRFDARAMAERVARVVAWLRRQKRFARLPIGLVGSGTGAAASLVASTLTDDVTAVVALGGRAALARDVLADVQCPTLFVAAAGDSEAIVSNCQVIRQMSAVTSQHLVRRAERLDEPAAIADVVEAAAGWFTGQVAHRGEPLAA